MWYLMMAVLAAQLIFMGLGATQTKRDRDNYEAKVITAREALKNEQARKV